MSAAVQTAAPARIRSPAAEFWRRLRRKHAALIAGAIVLVMALLAIFAPFVAPYTPDAPDYNNVLAGPSAAHFCGTDSFGRDIFSRIVWGGRVSLTIGLVSVGIGGVVGVALGLIAG
ncbi:MAG: glutathione ABC transporter permease, partial [Acetobacteraceae bacterium]|nr:glutathione ABC transporter permease [Acetobacteraceae bacterium]